MQGESKTLTTAFIPSILMISVYYGSESYVKQKYKVL